ncbi:MAG: ABC transporter permease [Desulfosarcinaceae bacterium]|nr:ABC transporter permease [Desulfosarcinaceae bacterium]
MLSIPVKMAWRNIWRHPRRTLLTTLAIAFACVLLIFMLSFQFGSYEAMINASIKIHTGHLQVQAAGYQEQQEIRRVIEDPRAVHQALAAIPEVDAHAARARAFALVASQERAYGIMVEGIDPAAEAQVSTLPRIIRAGAYLAPAPDSEDLSGALVGYLLARNLRVDVGDELTILGQGRDGSVAATVVRVRGIYRSGMDDYDRGAVQIHLQTFQEVFSMDAAVHEIVVTTGRLTEVGPIQRALAPTLTDLANTHPLVSLSWDALLPGLKQAIAMDLVSGAISYVILILVVAFSILNTFLMAIFERTHEFGVMLAIGARPARLTRLVLMESAGITLVGIGAGVLFGCLITGYFATHGIELGGASDLFRQYGIPNTLYPRLTVVTVTAGPLTVFFITLAAALYPALKIQGLKPVEALRLT